MPFNRVNSMKAMSFWLLILSSSVTKKRKDNQPNNDDSNNGGTTMLHLQPGWWCPGMMVVPLPQAGYILGYWDMGYWAALFYVLGSIVYVVDSFYLWPYFYAESNDDPGDPGVYLNTVASMLFVINALLCFLDWYMQREQLSVMNMIVDDSITGGFQLQSVSTKITWYYFFNNFFFLGAAVVFLVQSFFLEDKRFDLYNCSVGWCGLFWINFWGNFLYLISSVFAVLEYLEDKKLRERQGLPPLTLFPKSWESFDWFGWGDILYAATSLLQTLQPFFIFSSKINNDFSDGFYLNANVFFLIDSLAYYFGYVIFLYEMRRALYSGQVPIHRTGTICEFIGDTVQLASVPSLTDAGEPVHYPVFRRVEHGYVSIEEIREKLLVAREIRAHRASDPIGRMMSYPSKISPIQGSSTLVQRNSESSFSKYSAAQVQRLGPLPSDHMLFRNASTKVSATNRNASAEEDETVGLLTESLIGSEEKNL